MREEPVVSVGIMDRQKDVAGRLNGSFTIGGHAPVTGRFQANVQQGVVVLTGESGSELARSAAIRLEPAGDATFTLFSVAIGRQFHWERPEDQAFQGSLLLKAREDNTLAAINDIPAEVYLRSVVSSEMSASAPIEFLKAHAVLSRSWLLSALARKAGPHDAASFSKGAAVGTDELIRWYEREDHDIFDICADDHCQRYQGITKIFSGQPEMAVEETRGIVLTYGGDICDARYSKACGGLTDRFETAWDDTSVPYLRSISDAPVAHQPVVTEKEARAWIGSSPDAYCNVDDPGLLRRILPDFDQETTRFFRWTVEYSNEELARLLSEKSGLDFGELRAIEPLSRGPSGRIYRLRIVGSARTVTIGKELEIRRWLSKSHLYSSAFVVETRPGDRGEAEKFIFRGAGWGHGVGLCQIGAAVMASRGFSAREILSHYFTGVDLTRVY